MDRTSFLKAQPFLFPLESVSWPPPLPAETSERSSCRRETLLRDFLLSIEPLPCVSEDRDRLSQQSINTSRGPAFFAAPKRPPNATAAAENKRGGDPSSNDSFDPSMCPLELCVQSATLTLPPTASPAAYTENTVSSFSNRFTSPTAYQKLLHRQHRQQSMELAASHNNRSLRPQLRESTIVLKIDNLVCQMDLSHVENVDVQFDESDNAPNMEEGSKDDNAIRPPSLLIQFGNSCIFRIFSLRGVTTDNLSALKGVHNLLVQLLTAEDQVPSEFPNQFIFSAALASPAGSSTTAFSSSQEPGQRDFSRTSETPPSHNSGDLLKPSSTSVGGSGDKGDSVEGQRKDGVHNPQPPSSENRPASPTISEQLSIVRKKQAAYDQSKRDLNSLNEILMQPQTTVGSSAAGLADQQNSSKRLRVLQDQAMELLNSVPENLAASYCTQSQLQTVLQRQNEHIREYEKELDGLVNAFWPAPTRTGASHGTNNGGGMSRQSSMSRRPQIESSECIRRTNDLLQKHQEATEEKLALSFLPTRGC
jgi:hypothetical protein